MIDYGLINLVKQTFPHVSIRCSIAMNHVNFEDVLFLEEAGGDNIVLRFDCFSHNDLVKIKKTTSMQIEMIICGNRDFALTGRCTMSSYIRHQSKHNHEGRNMHPGSPNRGGLCYRVCLAPWNITNDKNEYLMCSSLNNIQYILFDEINDLLNIGVDWFKIQGRVYSPKHIAEITSFYREFIDTYTNSQTQYTDTKWIKSMKKRSDHILKDRHSERNTQTSKRLFLQTNAIT